MPREEDDEPLGVIELEESLSDAEKPPVLPAGKYIGEVQDVKIQTSGKGNKYFAVLFVISTDQVPADMAEYFDEGVNLYWNRCIVPNGRDRRALWNLRKFVEALGLDANTTAIDPNDWMGQKAQLIVRVGRYQGEDRPEIASVEAAERAAPARASRGRK